MPPRVDDTLSRLHMYRSQTQNHAQTMQDALDIIMYLKFRNRKLSKRIKKWKLFYGRQQHRRSFQQVVDLQEKDGREYDSDETRMSSQEL